MSKEADSYRQISEQIREVEKQLLDNAYARICRYDKCKSEFKTLDKRQWYCKHEHYLAANRERTLEKNKLRRAIINELG